jgi:hypothetical protein
MDMSLNKLNVGDMILFCYDRKMSVDFSWPELNSHNPWRIGQIVGFENPGNYVQIGNLEIIGAGYVTVYFDTLKHHLSIARNTDLAECTMVFSNRIAKLVKAQQPEKVVRSRYEASIVKPDEDTRYIALDQNGELVTAGYEVARTKKEWKEWIAEEINQNDDDSLGCLEFYAETTLSVKVKKTVDVCID